MTWRRVSAWLTIVLSLVGFGFVAWQHWRILHLGWHRAGVALVALAPLIILYGATLLRQVYSTLAADGTGDYSAAPPDQFQVFFLLSPLLVDWFENPPLGRSTLVSSLVGLRMATLAALLVLFIYLVARLRLRYRLTPTHLEVVVDGKVVMALQREAIILIPGVAGNVEEAEAERLGAMSGVVPTDSPGVPFALGTRIYYAREGQPRILVVAMTPELQQALALWMNNKLGGGRPT